MELHELIILIAGCVFAATNAIDTVNRNLKDRRAANRARLDRRTRQEYYDAADQREWDERLHKRYSTFCTWFSI